MNYPWQYLNAEPMLLRQVIAAHYFKDCEQIIEFGPGMVSVGCFTDIPVIAFDKWDGECRMKHSDIRMSCKPTHLGALVGCKFGFCALGIGFYDDDDTCLLAEELSMLSWKSVLEAPVDFSPSHEVLNRIVKGSGRKPILDVVLDVSANEFPKSDYPPRTKRRLVVC